MYREIPNINQCSMSSFILTPVIPKNDNMKFANKIMLKNLLRRNETPPLFDVLPFEINIENYFLLIGIICILFSNFPLSCGIFLNAFWGQML